MHFAAKAASGGLRRLLPGWLLHFGAAGVFGIALLDSSPIPLPIPGSTDILILVLGAHAEWPWLLALAALSGSVLGGYFTWAAGKKGGEAMLEHHIRKRLRERVTRWIRGHGIRTVMIAALLPPPIPLLPFLLGAGALGVTRRQLIVALGLARSLRYGVEAALATIYDHQILRLWHRYLSGWSDVILDSFIGLMAAAALFGIWKYRHDQHRHSQPANQTESRAA